MGTSGDRRGPDRVWVTQLIGARLASMQMSRHSLRRGAGRDSGERAGRDWEGQDRVVKAAGSWLTVGHSRTANGIVTGHRGQTVSYVEDAAVGKEAPIYIS